MKKLLLTATVCLSVASAYSQGTLLWGNSSTTLVSTNSYSGIGKAPAGSPVGVAAPSAGTGYVYGLFIAPTATDTGGIQNSAWQLASTFGTAAPLYGTNTTAATGGRYGVPGTASIAGFTSGTPVAIQIRGWSASFGKDWAAVQQWGKQTDGAFDVASTAWYGESAVAHVTLGGGGLPNASLYGTGAGQLNAGFVLNQINPVPEPTTFALAGLAGAALLIFRRRK